MEVTDLCGCGEPLHYPNPEAERLVRDLVAKHGVTVAVTTGDRAWHVPRHYIALHGLRAEELPDLAARYDWRKIDA